MDPSPTLQSKSELFWYCQSSALASQIVTLRSNFAVWQDTSGQPRVLLVAGGQNRPRVAGMGCWVGRTRQLVAWST